MRSFNSKGCRLESRACLGKSKVTFDTVRKISQTLPGTEEVTAYGSPAIKVRGTLMAGIPGKQGGRAQLAHAHHCHRVPCVAPAGRDALAQTDDATVLVRTVLTNRKPSVLVSPPQYHLWVRSLRFRCQNDGGKIRRKREHQG